MAGQTRSFAERPVREIQLRNLVEPLDADLFLVLSSSREYWFRELVMRDVFRQMSPVSAVIARDDQMMAVIRQLNISQAEL